MKKGGNVTYVATATVDGKEYKVSKSVTVKQASIHMENHLTVGAKMTKEI